MCVCVCVCVCVKLALRKCKDQREREKYFGKIFVEGRGWWRGEKRGFSGNLMRTANHGEVCLGAKEEAAEGWWEPDGGGSHTSAWEIIQAPLLEKVKTSQLWELTWVALSQILSKRAFQKRWQNKSYFLKQICRWEKCLERKPVRGWGESLWSTHITSR